MAPEPGCHGGDRLPGRAAEVRLHHPHHRWDLGRINRAECLHARFAPRSDPEGHGEVPGIGCSCGFYAHARRQGSSSDTSVSRAGGVVAGWGRLELHEGGSGAPSPRYLPSSRPIPAKGAPFTRARPRRSGQRWRRSARPPPCPCYRPMPCAKTRRCAATPASATLCSSKTSWSTGAVPRATCERPILFVISWLREANPTLIHPTSYKGFPRSLASGRRPATPQHTLSAELLATLLPRSPNTIEPVTKKEADKR